MATPSFNDKFSQIMTSEILVHIFSPSNQFATGAIQAFLEFMTTKTQADSPLQVALILLPTLYEDPVAAGPLLSLFLGSESPWFDLSILIDRQAPALFPGDFQHLDRYLFQLVNVLFCLHAGGDLNPLLDKTQDGRFFSVCLGLAEDASPKQMTTRILTLLSKHHSIDYFGRFRSRSPMNPKSPCHDLVQELF